MEGAIQEIVNNEPEQMMMENNEAVDDANAITSELQRRDQFKVYVSNLGTYMTQKETLKFLEKNDIKGIKTVKKQRGKTFAFVVFNSLEEREAGMKCIEQLTCKDKKLTCKDAFVQTKRNSSKRNIDLPECVETGEEKKARLEKEKQERDEIEMKKTTNDVVAPWWNIPYDEQKNKKELEMRQVLKRCSRRITRKENTKNKKGDEKKSRIGSVMKPCPEFVSQGKCMYGDRCKFLHVTLDEFEKMQKEKEEVEVETKEAEVEVKEEIETKEEVEAKEEEVETKEEVEVEAKEESTNKTKREKSDYNKDPDEGQMCVMHPILTNTDIDGYRNKCSFTIGKNKEGLPCVGFRMGNFVDGNVRIGEIEDVVVVSPLMKQAAKIVETFIRENTYETYDMCMHTGFWRSLLVRYSTKTNQMLLLLVVGNPYEKSLPNIEEANQKVTEDIRQEINKIMTTLKERVVKELPCVSSFGYQIFTGLSNPTSDCPIITLHGNNYIEEKLFDLTFRVSPYAFFQVNTPVAEILYKNIGDWLSLHENTLLLDICCGTGTIGLCLANRVKYLIGVDIEASAIEDAKLNAEINNIKNCEFICSPAEKVMEDLLRSDNVRKYDHIVMIVDPPRSGLHKNIISACRKCSAITELIYVSCNPTGSFVENTVSLCMPAARRVPGSPFTALKSQPVDLFPYTEHCELMTLFAHL